MIKRILQNKMLQLAERFPVLTLTGPRQSGKTTLCRMAFPDKPYANLELPDLRDYAIKDPRGFLGEYPDGVILDEVQRTPDLLSYIQVLVDERPEPGRFVVTGSQHFGLIDAVSQSLAGRTALLNLLPLGLDELRLFPTAPDDLFKLIHSGAYPRIHDRNIPAAEWLAGYVGTYLERDVRQVQNIMDLSAFQDFLGLCAGRVGQLLNLSALGADCGITHNTAKRWLSLLEASFIAFRLPPFHRNLRKRLTKSPKLYFHDTGLACYLLGIRDAEDLRLHPLRGALFENWVATEILKARMHRGVARDMCFYRDHRGEEVDFVVGRGRRLLAVEAKSGQTLPSDAFRSLRSFSQLATERGEGIESVTPIVVHGGDQTQDRSQARVISWRGITDFDWTQV